MNAPFSLTFIERLIELLKPAELWEELEAPDGGPYLPLVTATTPAEPAGSVRLWRGRERTPLDRMVHMRLIAGPVETQLLFAFGRSDSTFPHLHAQVVQFPPDGCVYNMDLLPRLDPVDHPEWFERVFTELRRPYRQATHSGEYSCAQAPANPALAIYMSPWGIASGRTRVDELHAVAPQIEAYAQHYANLAHQDGWESMAPVALATRDQRHLELFFSDELDPRAWNGVYKIIGEARGRLIKGLFKTPLRNPVT
ncbi:MAG: hypothetical protein V2J12_10880 [Gammaproteobacteria bacterium]|jgi:hypothetical protein|nr:hypothetical protein [Gammaproteobacteria bacterium]